MKRKQKKGAAVVKAEFIVLDKVHLLSSSIINKLLILLQYIFSLCKKLLGKIHVVTGKGKAKSLPIDLILPWTALHQKLCKCQQLMIRA